MLKLLENSIRQNGLQINLTTGNKKNCDPEDPPSFFPGPTRLPPPQIASVFRGTSYFPPQVGLRHLWRGYILPLCQSCSSSKMLLQIAQIESNGSLQTICHHCLQNRLSDFGQGPDCGITPPLCVNAVTRTLSTSLSPPPSLFNSVTFTFFLFSTDSDLFPATHP